MIDFYCKIMPFWRVERHCHRKMTCMLEQLARKLNICFISVPFVGLNMLLKNQFWVTSQFFHNIPRHNQFCQGISVGPFLVQMIPFNRHYFGWKMYCICILPFSVLAYMPCCNGTDCPLHPGMMYYYISIHCLIILFIKISFITLVLV